MNVDAVSEIDPAAPPSGSARTRVLYVEANRDGTVGGSHRILHDLIRHLDTERYEPLVLFYQDNLFADRLRAAGVEVHLWDDVCAIEDQVRHSGSRAAKVLDFGRAVVRRRRLIRRLGVDIVHLNNSVAQGNDDWLPASWLARVPCIVTVMGDARPNLDRVHRWLAFRFDRVVCISRYLYQSLARYGYPADRLVLAQTGVDLREIDSSRSRTRSEVRAEFGLGTDVCLVAMVGNIRRWKGQHVVIDALRTLSAAQRRAVTVVFAGDVAPEHTAYHQGLLDTVREAGLEGNVHFAGHRNDVHDLFGAADIALHASVYPEPFGLVLVEAMAAGLPVVAADEGGPAEVVTEQSGLTHRMGDADSLAAALAELIGDPERRARMGAAAREQARSFDITNFAHGVEAVYDEVLPAV